MSRPEPPKVFSIKARPGDIARFLALQQELDRRLPFGRTSKADVFELLVTSASAAVQRGELPVAASLPPGTILPGKSDAA